MYANYGREEDFKELVNLSVNATGKIVIMRYGKIYRGDKVSTRGNGLNIIFIIFRTLPRPQVLLYFDKIRMIRIELTI